MISLKKKMQILESLEKASFDYETIPEYLSYASVAGLYRPILKAIFSNLILLDTQISASYDLLLEEEWEQLFMTYSTPVSDSGSELLEKVECLSVNFSRCLNEIDKPEHKIEDVLEILNPIFKNKTRNMQFLLFKIAKNRPRHVFGYLMARLRKDPRVYAPFYCSLLARLKLDDNEEMRAFKLRCVNAYVNNFRSRKLSKNLESAVLGQFLLYILCFNVGYFTMIPGIKEDVDRLFELEVYTLMNKDVVDRFCDIFGYKLMGFESSKNDCVFSFPFDFPICPSIQDLVQADFNEFS